MKYALILLLFCACKIGKANRIDNLQNEAAVEQFIISVDKDIRQNLERWPIKVLNKQELLEATKPAGASLGHGLETWTKVDLNDDGQTDLIVYTRYYGLLVVMDTGKGDYKAIRIKSFPGMPTVVAKKIGGRTILLTKHSDCGEDDALIKASGRKTTDTLIYKFGQFVELNDAPANYDIDSVTIFTGLCALGLCPSYKLVATANGQGRYVAGTKIPNQGVFTGQLTPSKTKQLMGLINYIGVKDMQGRYQPGCILDGGGWQLIVTFKDGSQKKISDFNRGGTFGLEAVYALMDDIAKTQAWKQIK